MTKQLIGALVMAVVMVLPWPLWAAEAVKLRHALSLYADTKDASMSVPQGVGCRGSAVVVADSGNGRLLKFAYVDGSAKGGDEIKATQIVFPTTVEIDTKGDILVLDGRQRRIVRLGGDGAFKGLVQPQDLPVPQEFVPISFRLDGADNLYILDVFNRRVLVLDPAGKFTRSLELPEDDGFITDVEVDARGNVLLLDAVEAAVYVFAKGGKAFEPLGKGFKEAASFPVHFTVDGRGTLYVADRNGGGIAVIGPDGSLQGRQSGYGWKEGLLRYPSQLCINEKDEVFVADRSNNRVQIFTIMK